MTETRAAELNPEREARHSQSCSEVSVERTRTAQGTHIGGSWRVCCRCIPQSALGGNAIT